VQISHYRIEEEIGRGGMGVVYRAVDTRLGRTVAVKMLASEATTDPDRRARFIQEARSASVLNHPHIVTIYDVGEQDGATFIAMELVDGTPLDKMMRGGPLPVSTALQYAVQIVSALGVAHEAGIVHRDIKPANIVITRDGRAKVLDFGLAKLMEPEPTDATMTGVGTRPGIILGTAAYMSPEQAQGHPVDSRSDLFSFGAVLYEMLAGRRPFAGGSEIGLITAILRDQPPPLQAARADVPAALQSIVDRCLAKDPGARFPGAPSVKAALEEVEGSLSRPRDMRWRRSVVVPIALLVLAAAAVGGWLIVQGRRAQWARLQIPEIERLTQTADSGLAAIRLARAVERYAPDDVERARQRWYGRSFTTSPEGAEVQLKDYADVGGPWESIGRTPIRNYRLPLGLYRARLTLAGHDPVEISVSDGTSEVVRLWPAGQTPPGMMFVAGGRYTIGVAGTRTLPDYWIDRTEVTNQDYKRFVDAGGYGNPQFWKHPFTTPNGTLTFEEAMSRFRDPTGRPGPAVWELGSYPEGRAEYPVSGISWFEAAAFAEFSAKSLPTIYHWHRAAGADSLFSNVLRLSNFDGKGVEPAGRRAGVGPRGTLDMAGNVKEWCLNASAGTDLRYILGGAWNEPAYRFRDPEAADPWHRAQSFGMRLVKNLGSIGGADEPVPRVHGDPDSLVPVADVQFEVFKAFYAYDRTPLDAKVEAVDDSSPHFRRETVSFAAAYGSERIPAYLYLPKNARPPYQTVLFFPNSYARGANSSNQLDLSVFEFVVRSGRALLYPVYKGTFERGGGTPITGPSASRDMQVAWTKDVFRAIDYLETRPDLDISRLPYYSISMGGFYGPIPVALEPRIKLAIFAAGGLRFNYPQEVQPVNFMPRVNVPVLLVNGRDDFSAPVAAQQRFIDLIGTPREHKRHVMLDGGHIPNDFRGLIREVLDWLDKYQPVRGGS
jgi:predicted Ser/Thr protein kinase